MKRIISIWLPRLATERLGRPGPVATVAPDGRRRRIAAVDDAARAAGIRPGQTASDARAVCPDLALVPADPAGDARRLDALAAWCGRYSPWTAVAGLEPGGGGGLWIDATGCAHLFGGEAALLDDLSARLGHAARAAIADTPGAAWAAARFGRQRLVPADATGDFLTDLPVAALRLSPAVVDDLDRLGLRRVGDLSALGRGDLAVRFGPLVGRRLDQALGRLAEPISPRRPEPPAWVTGRFAEPIGHGDDIAAAARDLLGRLCQDLAAGDRGLTRLAVDLWRVDGGHQALSLGTARPSRDPDHLFRLLAERLDRLDPGFGIEVLRLAAETAEPLAPAQTALPRLGAGAAADQALALLVDRLGERLGPGRIHGFAAQASHLPERASRVVPALGDAGTDFWPVTGPRPPALVQPPEPIEVVAPVPDDPPLLFRWRGGAHRVVRADGPERIAAEWWRHEPRWPEDVRDYYRVEDRAGARFWVYRAGLYQPDQPARWFLHGLFG